MICIELNKAPKDCYDCKFCQNVQGLDGLICLATQEMRRTNYNHKPEWCPVKEIDDGNIQKF